MPLIQVLSSRRCYLISIAICFIFSTPRPPCSYAQIALERVTEQQGGSVPVFTNASFATVDGTSLSHQRGKHEGVCPL